jgi:hypothetical protein
LADNRKAKRFELRLPFELVRAGSRRVSHSGETVNVSSGGVLFQSPEVPVEVGQPIEYLISLPTGQRIGDVRLRCMGKVVRKSDEGRNMAATLERYEFVRAGGGKAAAAAAAGLL